MKLKTAKSMTIATHTENFNIESDSTGAVCMSDNIHIENNITMDKSLKLIKSDDNNLGGGLKSSLIGI